MLSFLRRNAQPLVFLVAVYGLLLFARAQVWTGMGIDEVLYYAQGASVVWDGDLDLSNDVLESRNDFALRREMAERLFREGEPDLPFSFGLPFLYSVPGFFAKGVDAFSGGQLAGNDRYGWFHRLVPSGITWLAMLAGLMACAAAGRRYTTEWRAVGVTLAVFLATGIAFYTWHAPAMAHGVSFGVAGLVLLASVRYREAPSLARAGVAGVLAGLAFLVRWQEALVFVVPLAAWVAGVRGRALPRRAMGLQLLVMVAGFALMALPQLAFWRTMHGTWLLAPQGAGFFHLDWGRPALVLFSPLNGWVWTHPFVGMLLLALVPAWKRRDWLLGAIVAVVVVQIVVNSLPGDWWAGGSFGARRFAGVLPLLVIPAAMAADRCSGRVLVVFGSIAGLLAAVNLLVMMRWVHDPLPALLWGPFVGNLGEYVRFLTGSREVAFSSDLFNAPEGVGRVWAVRFLFVLVVAGIAAVGFMLARLGENARQGIERMAVVVLPALAVGWAVLLMNAPFANREFLASWNRETARDFAREDYGELRRKAMELPRSETFRGAVDIYRLERMLEENDYTGAEELSRRIRAAAPRTVLDVWVRHVRIQAPERGRWIDELLPRISDPNPETLVALHSEAVRRGDGERRALLHGRLRGPRWRQVMRDYEAVYWDAASYDVLREHLRLLFKLQPFWLPGYEETVRLRRSDGRAERYMAALERLTEERLAVAGHVARWHPDHRAAFERSWRGALFHRAHALEELGRVEEMEELLALAEQLGMEAGALKALGDHVREARVFESRLRGEPETLYPTGEITELREFPEEAIATVDAHWLRERDGWFPLEFTDDRLYAWRWNWREVSFFRPGRPLAPGRYAVYIDGYRFEGEEYGGRIRVDFYGVEQQSEFEGPQGYFFIREEFTLKEPLGRPLIRIRMPLFPIERFYEGVDDPRMVGMNFSRLWIVELEDE